MGVLRWLRRRKGQRVRAKPDPVLSEEIRRERLAAEQRLSDAHRDVIIPLSEMRARNHIQDDIGRLITRRARREAGNS